MVHINDAPAKDPQRIEDGDRLLPGEGVIALERLVAEVVGRGYRGPWSIETFNPEYWRQDPLEVARRARAALELPLASVRHGAYAH